MSERRELLLLIKSGKDVTSVFTRAVRDGRVEAVRFLLECKPELAVGASEALWQALYYGHDAMGQLLLSAGTPTATDMQGRSALHAAARGGCVQTLATLLDAGNDVELADSDGYRPLHWAAMEGETEVVELLLARGASVDARTQDGDAPLDLAQAQLERGRHSFAPLVQRLHAAGARARPTDPAARLEKRWGPLPPALRDLWTRGTAAAWEGRQLTCDYGDYLLSTDVARMEIWDAGEQDVSGFSPVALAGDGAMVMCAADGQGPVLLVSVSDPKLRLADSLTDWAASLGG